MCDKTRIFRMNSILLRTKNIIKKKNKKHKIKNDRIKFYLAKILLIFTRNTEYNAVE